MHECMGKYSKINDLFSNVVVTLSVIRDSVSFKQTTRDQANDLVCKLLQFDTVLTAFLHNRIFSITAPLSEYLQTRGIDLLQMWRMVETKLLSMNQQRFPHCPRLSSQILQWCQQDPFFANK